jgi:predicted enzyme related to lactoylglutathione lyase
MANAINWFEIPAVDFDRAVTFYTKVLGQKMHIQEMGGIQMGFLSMGEDSAPGEVGGAVCFGEFYKPASDGAILYLNGGKDLNEPLSRVEAAGGKVLMPKTQITEEIGYMAMFMDSEGNRMAFHSPS